MKLYNSRTPNGARVSIFLQEKGIEIPTTSIDVAGGESRSEAYLAKNSLGEVPALELDDGMILTESVAICRYLETLYPETPLLFGRDPLESATIEMWNRRMELKIQTVAGDIGLHEFDFFKDRVEQNPDYAAAQRRLLHERFVWLDRELSDGRAFVSGDVFTIADITGMVVLMICGFAGFRIPDDLMHVKKWEIALKERPSWP